MKALTLDFRRRNRGLQWLGVALLAAGVAGAAVTWHQYERLLDDVYAAETHLHKLDAVARRKAAAGKPAADTQRTALEVNQAGQVLMQLRTPWSELFANVEAANIPDVALLSIESDTGKQSIKLSGEAKNLDAMLAYLRDLQQQPMLGEVYLQSHQLQQQDPQHPVRFAVTATWRAGR